MNTSAVLIHAKHPETHLAKLDSASEAQRSLSAVLIGRSRASLVLGCQNLQEKASSDTINPAMRDYTLRDLRFASSAYQVHYQVKMNLTPGASHEEVAVMYFAFPLREMPFTQKEFECPPVSNDPFGRASTVLIHAKHRETHLAKLDSASEAQIAERSSDRAQSRKLGLGVSEPPGKGKFRYH